jgi:hypothetical protein
VALLEFRKQQDAHDGSRDQDFWGFLRNSRLDTSGKRDQRFRYVFLNCPVSMLATALGLTSFLDLVLTIC